MQSFSMARQEEELDSIGISTHSTTAAILREAIKLPSKNVKLMLEVLLLILSPIFLLACLHEFFAKPLINKVEDGYENSSVDLKSVRSLLGIEFLFSFAFSVIFFFGMVLTIKASALTYIAKYSRICSLKISWKNPLITWLYVSIFTGVYVVLTILVVSIVSTISTYKWWSRATGFVGVVLYLYPSVVLTLGLVISVMENDCYGIKAIQRSRRLITGRQIQGLGLMLILAVISCPIDVVLVVVMSDDDDEIGYFTQFAFGFVTIVLFCISKFFIFVVFTVLCYECKLSHGEGVEMELETRRRLVFSGRQVH